MDNITREQYKQLRQQGYSQQEVQDIARKGKVYETLNQKSFKQKGLLQTVGGFLGMEAFGRGIGTAASNALGTQDQVIQANEQATGIQTNLIKRIREKKARGEDTTALETALSRLGGDSSATAEGVTDIGTSGLSNREVLGSAAQTGLSVIGLRGGLPTAKTFGMANSPIIGGITAGAASGAAFGAAGAVTEGEGVVQGTLKGAAIGGAVGGATGALSKYINQLAQKTPESKLGEMKDSLKSLKRSFEKNSRYRMVDGQKVYYQNPLTTLSETRAIPKVVDGKIDATDAKNVLQQMIGELDDQSLSLVDDATQSGTKLTVGDFRKVVEESIRSNENLQASGAVNKTLKAAAQLFADFEQSYGKEIPASQLNKIRVAMNKVYDPTDVDAARAVGDAARKFIYENVPGTKAALAREGELISALKFLEVMDGHAVKGGRMGRYFTDLIGAIAGSTTDVPVVGPIVGALGARAVANQAQQNFFKPVTGQAARALLSVVDSLPTDQAGNITKTAVLNVIAELAN